MIRGFQVLAVILAGVAVFFWWRENTDWAFASGVVAASSYLLSLRFQMKERVMAADAERDTATPNNEPIDEADDLQ